MQSFDSREFKILMVELRERVGLVYWKDVAELLELESSAVSNWIQGRCAPSHYSIRKIARELGCSINQVRATLGMGPMTFVKDGDVVHEPDWSRIQTMQTQRGQPVRKYVRDKGSSGQHTFCRCGTKIPYIDAGVNSDKRCEWCKRDWHARIMRDMEAFYGVSFSPHAITKRRKQQE